MSSMEVAEVVEPYANFLIASQETEPGWAGVITYLNKYLAAEDAINMYFAQLDANLNTKVYSSIVRGRTQARGFGVYSTS